MTAGHNNTMAAKALDPAVVARVVEAALKQGDYNPLYHAIEKNLAVIVKLSGDDRSYLESSGSITTVGVNKGAIYSAQSTLSYAIPMAGGAAVADGPLLVGDIVAGGILIIVAAVDLYLYAKNRGPKPPSHGRGWEKDGKEWVAPDGTRWRYRPEDGTHFPHWDKKVPGKGKRRVLIDPKGRVFK